MNLAQILPQNINFKLGNFSFSPTYLQVGAILFLLFLLILSLAQVRRHFMLWSFKGALFGIFLGFLLALILEGFLIIGGKTAVTELVCLKNVPKPLSTILDLCRDKLITVLGVKTQIPSISVNSQTSLEDLIKTFQSLRPDELTRVRKIICAP